MRIIRSLQLLTATLLISLATTVSAQQPADAMPQYSEAQIEQFAAAFVEVDTIRQEYTTSIGAAEDQQQAQALQQEAQTKMAEAVQGSGLEIQIYNSIAQQLQSDEALQQRVMEHIQ